MLALRGLIQPLTERRMLSDPDSLRESMRAAEASQETSKQDPLLGVAMQAVKR
jgi:hypothetical protein